MTAAYKSNIVTSRHFDSYIYTNLFKIQFAKHIILIGGAAADGDISLWASKDSMRAIFIFVFLIKC
jgi:hypothetical protein